MILTFGNSGSACACISSTIEAEIRNAFDNAFDNAADNARDNPFGVDQAEAGTDVATGPRIVDDETSAPVYNWSTFHFALGFAGPLDVGRWWQARVRCGAARERRRA
jgi:hypothetical protein